MNCWKIERSGIVEAHPSGTDHCGYIGLPKYRYEVKITGCRVLDAHGFTIDNNDIDAVVRLKVDLHRDRSCEHLACLICMALWKKVPGADTISVTMGDADGTTKITFESSHYLEPLDRLAAAACCVGGSGV